MKKMKLTAEVIEGFVASLLSEGFDQLSATPQFHRELWELCCSDSPLVAIAAPRAHAKSTAVSLAYCLASMLFRNSQFCLLVSDTEGQAVEFLGSIKKELEVNENLRIAFGISRLKKNTEADIICEMEDGYCFRILAKGSEQRVRGVKWDHLRPDLIICDDLENDEIVMNPDRREKFRKWIIGALLPSRAKISKVRVVGTILHLDSFLARICPTEGERFAERVSPVKLVNTNKRAMWRSVTYAGHTGTHPRDIHNDSHILWPERFNKEYFLSKYEEAAGLGHPELYSQEQLNRPLDEAYAIFKKSDFIAMTDKEKEDIALKKIPLMHYAGADLAISEKERADYSVFHVMAMDSEGYLYHRETVRQRMDGKEIVDTIISLQQRYDLQWFAIEQDKIGKAIGPFLSEAMLRNNVYVKVEPINPHNDKKVRIRSMQARMRSGTVKFDKSKEEYLTLEQELLRFPRDKHDDQVDALACIGLALEKMTKAQTVEEEYEDEMQEQESYSIETGKNSYTGY